MTSTEVGVAMTGENINVVLSLYLSYSVHSTVSHPSLHHLSPFPRSSFPPCYLLHYTLLLLLFLCLCLLISMPTFFHFFSPLLLPYLPTTSSPFRLSSYFNHSFPPSFLPSTALHLQLPISPVPHSSFKKMVSNCTQYQKPYWQT